MLGIPFYGYKIDYAKQSHNPIVNNNYLEFLQENKPIINWNSHHEECNIRLSKGSNLMSDVQYPCLKFLMKRLEIAEDYGIGVFAWEGGQPLEYFYNLF